MIDEILISLPAVASSILAKSGITFCIRRSVATFTSGLCTCLSWWPNRHNASEESGLASQMSEWANEFVALFS